ncbi:MAG TPA: glycogen synthase [Steroidobacteraceae bacterium]|jgi:starch synthase|nr:glycogen synthase [Steroidobacteraceae bacterium]
MPLRICFVAAELTPLAKAGGLADVSGALVKYLQSDGHDVRAFLPFYGGPGGTMARRLREAGIEPEPVAGVSNLTVRLGAHRLTFSLLKAHIPGPQAQAKSAAQVYLVDCPQCFARDTIYDGAPDEYLRFLLLTHAAFVSCQYLVFAPEIMHFHDWHTAIGTALLRSTYAWDRLFTSARSVLTIHNIGYQGIVGAQTAAEVLPDASLSMFDGSDLAAGHIGLLRTGIRHADLITTVSPTYAHEIQGREYGMGLEGLLAERADSLVGVLNGVDYEDWDPRVDRYLPEHYDESQLAVKAALKQQLLGRLGLARPQLAPLGPGRRGLAPEAAARTPLLGVVSRLVTQKGLDLLFEALPRLLPERNFALAALGTGESGYEEFFAALARSYPTRVYFRRGYDDDLAHWIEAASDLFLMPSRYEPCGLNQMYSLRYGTVPVVRRTGGLADSVEAVDFAAGTGTGFVFDEYSGTALTTTVRRALERYGDAQSWQGLVRRGMAQDFSWPRQVQRYVSLYEGLLAP